MEQLMKKTTENARNEVRQGQGRETERKTTIDERFKNTYLRPPKPVTITPGGLNPFLLSPRI